MAAMDKLPVAIRRALFWIDCRRSQFDALIMGDQMGLAYSSVLRMMDLYVMISVSLS